MQIWKEENRRQMIADDFMCRQLSIKDTASLEACSAYLLNGIVEEDRGRVEAALREMEETGKTIQTEFAWVHPQRGISACAFPGCCWSAQRRSAHLKATAVFWSRSVLQKTRMRYQPSQENKRTRHTPRPFILLLENFRQREMRWLRCSGGPVPGCPGAD